MTHRKYDNSPEACAARHAEFLRLRASEQRRQIELKERFREPTWEDTTLQAARAMRKAEAVAAAQAQAELDTMFAERPLPKVIESRAVDLEALARNMELNRSLKAMEGEKIPFWQDSTRDFQD